MSTDAKRNDRTALLIILGITCFLASLYACSGPERPKSVSHPFPVELIEPPLATKVYPPERFDAVEAHPGQHAIGHENGKTTFEK